LWGSRSRPADDAQHPHRPVLSHPDRQNLGPEQEPRGGALDLARAAKFDGQAIDSIHMLAFVDTATAGQVMLGGAAGKPALAP